MRKTICSVVRTHFKVISIKAAEVRWLVKRQTRSEVPQKEPRNGGYSQPYGI